MSKNKVRKTVSLNITNPDDFQIIKKISAEDFNFNSYVRKLILEDIKREKSKVIQKSGKGGITIKMG